MTDKERSRLSFAVQKFREATIELNQTLGNAKEITGKVKYPFDRSFSQVADDITDWIAALNEEINAEK